MAESARNVETRSFVRRVLWGIEQKLVLLCFAIVLFGSPIFAVAATYGSGAYDSGTFGGLPPTVTTGSSSAITQTSATLSGSITNIGTTSPMVRGFTYGTDTTYGATTTDSSGPFSVGSFSTTTSSLTCNTSYHFRAYATSTNGIGYGDDSTFTTSACSSGGGGGGSSGGGGSGGGGSSGSSGGGGGGAGGPLLGITALNDTSGLTPTLISPAAVSAMNSAAASTSTASSAQASISNSQQLTFTFMRNLKLGMSGDDVRELQVYLNTNGYPVATSGAGSTGKETDYFGPATWAALAKFQKANRLFPGGYFGPQTRGLIQSTRSNSNSQSSATTTPMATFTRNLKLGMSGEDVRELQVYLNTHGYPVATSGAGSTGQETDYFGPATWAALAKFQKANRLFPGGYFGPQTRGLIQK